MATEENGVFICAPRVGDLSISGSPNFSVAALRRLVESKLHLPLPAEFPDEWILISARFEAIQIFGDAPPFSPQDVAWFQEDVPCFSCPEFADSSLWIS